MVLGSLIAGSTPVGGGVVAFPVLLLHFKMEPQHLGTLRHSSRSIMYSYQSFIKRMTK